MGREVITVLSKSAGGFHQTQSRLLAIVFSVILILSCAVASPATSSYDGKWWLSTNEMQHRGFVQGFVVCYVNLVNCDAFRESFQAYNLRLNAYLKAHPKASLEPLNILLRRLAAPPYAHPVHRSLPGNESSEEVNQKWGAHEDGDDWRSGSPWNLGFIQGFLDCYSNNTKQPYGTFSKSDEWYVSAISTWYGTKQGDPDAINSAREKEKIPEVLFRFRDQSGTSKFEERIRPKHK